MVSSADALTTAPLVIAATGAATAQTAPLLFIPGAEALAAESEIIVVDDSRLTPGVEGLDVGEVVVIALGGWSGVGRGRLF